MRSSRRSLRTAQRPSRVVALADAPRVCERIAAPMLTFLVRRLALALVTLVLLSMLVFALGAALARRRRAQRARRLRHPGVGRRIQQVARSRPLPGHPVPRLGQSRRARRLRLVLCLQRVRQRHPRAGASEVGRARPLRLRAHAPAGVRGRAPGGAQGLSPARPHHQRRRALADGGAGVRLCTRRHRRLRAGARLAARVGALARRRQSPHPAPLPAAAGTRPRGRAVRLRRPDGARGHDRGPGRRLHPHGLSQGPRHARRSCSSMSCATRSCPPSPSWRRRRAISWAGS